MNPSKTLIKRSNIAIYLLFISLLIMGLYVPNSSAIDHSLLNPGFESWSSGSPDDWDVSSGITIAQELSIFVTGSSSLKVSGAVGENIWQNRTFTANPSMSYLFSCQVFSDNSGAVKLGLFVNGSTSALNASGFSAESVNLVSWQELSVLVTPGFTPQYYFVEIQISTILNGQKKNYIDDCVFSEVPQPDLSAPVITSAGNKTFEIGSTINKISWMISDPEPKNYTIYQDEISIDAGNWTSGSTITHLISGLNVGIYNFTIIANDLSNNIATDTIYVTMVQDATAPIIVHPTDPTIEVGSTSNTISWVVTDANPNNFTIFKDDLSISTGNWSSTAPISQSIDGLGIGTYNYTLLVQDEFNRFSSDQVLVMVIGVTTTATGTTATGTTTTGTTATGTTATSTTTTSSTSSTEDDGDSPILAVAFALSLGIINRYFRRKRLV
ncbi:MAG: hypothetical protein IH840_06755 [Candidatus Heimdallarchaeota archaeon]|nr:hypothetical protein [Candidatus Heimdallarchaeota archaeon]